MNHHLKHLNILIQEEKDYNLEELKNELSIKKTKTIYKMIISLIEEKLQNINFDNIFEELEDVSKLIFYVPEFSTRSIINVEFNIAKINGFVNLLKTKKQELIKNQKNDCIIREMISKLENINLLLKYRVEDNTKNASYKFLNSIVFELEDSGFLKETIKIFPKIVNSKNEEKEYFIEKVLNIYIDKLKNLNDNKSDTEVFYYNFIIEQFFLSEKANFKQIKIKMLSNIDNALIKTKNKKSKYFLTKLKTNINNDYQNKDDEYKELDLKYNKNYDFSEEIIKELEEKKETSNNYIDLRDLFTFTIDPTCSKELDDAFSIKLLSNGNNLLYIHITDVSKFVPKDSNIDKEASIRGKTIYLSDKVIPMIPTEIGRFQCSLSQNSTRNAITCAIEIEKNGNIVQYQFFNSLIKIDKNLSYDNADEILLKGDKEDSIFRTLKEAENISEMLRNANDDKKNYRDLEAIVDSLKDCEKTDEIALTTLQNSHKIVCEFMILINHKAAEEFHKSNLPFIYRVHKDTDLEKKLKEVKGAKEFFESQNIPENQIRKILSKMITPNMCAAYFSEKNCGHYGLNLPFYSQISSPIRRYSDLFDQRIMQDLLLNANLKDETVYYYESIVEQTAIELNKKDKINNAYLEEYNKIKIKSKFKC